MRSDIFIFLSGGVMSDRSINTPRGPEKRDPHDDKKQQPNPTEKVKNEIKDKVHNIINKK